MDAAKINESINFYYHLRRYDYYNIISINLDQYKAYVGKLDTNRKNTFLNSLITMTSRDWNSLRAFIFFTSLLKSFKTCRSSITTQSS